MEKVLSAKDICSIVKACASSGVTDLQMGDLHIKFGKPSEADPINFHYISSAGETNLSSANENTSTDEDSEPSEDELNDLLMNNPAEYERRRLEG